MSEEIGITGFDLAEKYTGQIGPASDGLPYGTYRGYRPCGEGATPEEAATNFFKDFQSKNIDFSKPHFWRRLPEMDSEKDIPTQTVKYRFSARLSVFVGD